MTISRVKPSGWSTNEKLTSTQITQVDINAAKALDKTAADTLDGYITVSATGGMNFTSGSQLIVADGATSNIHIGNGGNIKIDGTGRLTTTSGGRIILGDNDYPQFSTARTRSKVVPFWGNSDAAEFLTNWDPYNAYACYQSKTNGAYLICNLTPHVINGATLSNVRLTFRVGSSHANVPANMPWLRVMRIDTTGAIGGFLQVGGTLGIVSMPPALTGAAWYNGGNSQTFDYTCTQNNVIDTSQYVYMFDFTDESGTNAHGSGSGLGNYLHSLRLDFTNITDMRPE